MNPQNWEELQAAFAEAVALDDAAERARYIAGLESGNPGIATELKRMLDADGIDDRELLAPVQAVAESLGAAASDFWLGKTLGNYRLCRKIAVGGMSAVYFGQRIDEQFEQDVAIKIVASSILSDELNTRFRTERQILASLRHRNIAQLYDGGATDDGMPYLIMEYIDGLPIDRYCDEKKLDVEGRLKLFMQVCAAVDFAHRNLIVHRDIKPSNILVTGNGEPKLLDFGIAKPLTKTQLSQTIAVTHASARAMTPEYASPEQVRGEPITTATDVYSLGVLLYKLLSGRMPYPSATGLGDLANAIVETLPSRPSTVITLDGDGGDVAPAIVSSRGTSVSGLRKKLAGDLDTITLAALHKEPERRYSSARAFADDIARYLAHEPVSARPDSLAYRARKFATRHRLGVAAGGAAAIVITGLVSFYTWRLTAERNRAELEAQKAHQVVEFMTGIFRSASPYYTHGEEISVRDILARGASQLESALADQPEILAELLMRLGTIHQDLGDFTDARPLLERSLALQRAMHGASDISLVPVLLSIGRAQREADELEPALASARRALAIAEAADPGEPALVAAAWHLVGNTNHDLEHYAEALEANVKAVAIYGTLRPDLDEEYAVALNDAASEYFVNGEDEQALDMAGKAYDIELAQYGQYHPTIATNLTLRASIQHALARMDEAERLLREALEIREHLFGREHPEFAISLFKLAELISDQERWDEVESLANEALAIFEKSFGDDHYWTAVTRGVLAEVYSETGRADAALELAESTLQFSRRSSGEQSWTTAIAYAEYGDALLEAYRDDDAVSAYKLSVEAFRLNDGGLATAYTEGKLGRALLLTGDAGAAETVIDTALRYCRTEAPPRHSMVGRVLVAYGELAIARHDFAAATDAAGEALAIMAVNGQDGSTWYWLAHTVLAAAMAGDGRYADARIESQSVIDGLARDNGTRSRAEDSARALLQAVEERL